MPALNPGKSRRKPASAEQQFYRKHSPRIGELAVLFRAAKPFPHVVLDDFLPSDLCSRTLEEFPQFNSARAVNEFGKVGGKSVESEIWKIGPAFREIDACFQSRLFLEFVEQITGIPGLLFDPFYYGGGTHLNLNGQDLAPHTDFSHHPATRWHRRLNILLFLNPEWDLSWGGILELHTNPWLRAGRNPVTGILPLWNRCVIFETSESSWHGFTRIQLPIGRSNNSRKSIALYLYTQSDREKKVPRQTTIYVERQLPERFRSGYLLNNEDIPEIETLIARRDQQLQLLYQREKKLNAIVDRLRQRQWLFRLWQFGRRVKMEWRRLWKY